jgi:hypothetical protein
MFDTVVVDPTVEFLVELAGTGRALERIGTGRIALPLSRGAPVHGIDVSDAMVSRLPAKPSGADIGVTIGDFATTTVTGRSRSSTWSSTRS